MSIIAGVKQYIQAMVDKVSGMKVLILDTETVGIISMVFSQSDILRHEVYLTENIEAESFFEQEEKMRHMNAVCFLRPTNKNFIKLSQELKNPKYNEYHVFFTNVVPHHRLEQLACCDEHEVVRQVQEFYADVYAVGHELFSLNLPSTARLTENANVWSSYEESVFDRMIEGLLSVCLNLRMVPSLRYTASSQLTRQVAERLQKRLQEEQGLCEGLERERRGEPAPVLLLLDRRNDPVTPLLNQWTYQAMIHELLTMENNRVDMRKAEGIRPELEMIVMSPSQDQFFEENMLANFGDLGVSIQKYVSDYQKQTKNTTKIESIEEMQRFVDQYPEFRKLSGNVSKHVAVVHELSRLVEVNGLLDVSQVEQEIACSDNRQEHYKAVLELLQNEKVTHFQKLRLVLLYAIRYEGDPSIPKLKQELHRHGIDEGQVKRVDQLLRYAGQHVRSVDLFQSKSWTPFKAIAKHVQGVENVYTQHKSHLHGVAESLMKGKLKESTYPYIESYRSSTIGKDQKVSRAVVFVVGGTTFEEARDVAELNKAAEGSRTIVLGGTTIHNSFTFLTDVALLDMPKGAE
mmetsp:Transcript_24532/g.53376  ORF Transcript_24532/g.53376 Transcript_24532/m.53376 type:complete len:574 (+) Transcript_24532:147-1868(+)|eukprot:CAMPEP_0206559874 /NCGR_PEP_ID=MMETSP0325_2-20121206/20673_1 /ASSEMBLY_ACC=CAM_ASM_000347 /TAXON_ID=2866 /ORGANISM="Crypthecodinium cohnii, Strain Seligo" /LENGTH=573 /DNA_ID=CAMNT_0054061497 /DNA_START=138 /DNA_END=1859 /DNA_ORIENTATION=+